MPPSDPGGWHVVGVSPRNAVRASPRRQTDLGNSDVVIPPLRETIVSLVPRRYAEGEVSGPVEEVQRVETATL